MSEDNFNPSRYSDDRLVIRYKRGVSGCSGLRLKIFQTDILSNVPRIFEHCVCVKEPYRRFVSKVLFAASTRASVARGEKGWNDVTKPMHEWSRGAHFCGSGGVARLYGPAALGVRDSISRLSRYGRTRNS